MSKGKWEIYRGECWYTSATFKAEGALSSAYPPSVDVHNISAELSEEMMHKFLCETQLAFPNTQIWLVLNKFHKNIMMALKDKKKIDWTVIRNPLSESARVLYVSPMMN